MEVEGDDFGYFADDEGRVDDFDDRLVRNPFLHGSHGYSIDVVPEHDFVVVEVLIVEKGALEGKRVGKDESFLPQVHVSGLDDSVEHAVEVQTVAHRLSDDHIHLSIEIVPGEDLDQTFHLVLFHYLLDHV